MNHGTNELNVSTQNNLHIVALAVCLSAWRNFSYAALPTVLFVCSLSLQVDCCAYLDTLMA